MLATRQLKTDASITKLSNSRSDARRPPKKIQKHLLPTATTAPQLASQLGLQQGDDFRIGESTHAARHSMLYRRALVGYACP